MATPVQRLSKADIAAAVDKHVASAAARVDLAAQVDGKTPATEEDMSLLSYKVPMVSEDGTCSRLDKLMPDPHNTMTALQHAVTVDGRPAIGTADYEAKRARAVNSICQAVADATGSQWVGIYERVHLPNADHDVLCKLQYIGAPSRPFFPLTAAFAEHSNNSTVGLSGSAVLISDTDSMASDTPYYTCDGRVRAEFCAPITRTVTKLDGTSEEVVVGIIDAEAWKPNVYDEKAVGLILDVCRQLGETNMLRTLL